MNRDEMWAAFEAHGRAERAQDLDGTMATVHADGLWEDIASGETWRGPAEIRRFYVDRFASLGDWSFRRRAVHATDDHVVSEVTITGTHRGPMQGVAATGRKVTLHEIVVFSFRDGKVSGERMYLDRLSVLRQLGR